MRGTAHWTQYETRKEWLVARRTAIGGSDCPVILGTGRFGSPFSLWGQKVGLSSVDETEPMRWGNALEKAILQEWAKDVGWTERVVHCENMHVTHPDVGWLRYSPDGYLLGTEDEPGEALIEVKNVSSYAASDWAEGLPSYYLDQVQCGLHCVGVDVCYVVALLGGNRCVYVAVHRDTEWLSRNLARLTDFYERVVTLNPPEPEGTDEDEDALGEFYDSLDPVDAVQLGEEFYEIHEEFVGLKEQESGIQKRKRALRQRLLKAMGGAEYAEIPGVNGRYVHAVQERKGYTVEPSTSHVLRFQKPKKVK